MYYNVLISRLSQTRFVDQVQLKRDVFVVLMSSSPTSMLSRVVLDGGSMGPVRLVLQLQFPPTLNLTSQDLPLLGGIDNKRTIQNIY